MTVPKRVLSASLAVLLLAVAGLSVWPRDPEDPWAATEEGPAGTSELLRTLSEHGRAGLVTSTPLLMRGDGRIHAPATVLVVTGATRSYTEEEATAFHEFLLAGGRALVAEEGGLASSLTARYGIDFERVPVLDPGGDTQVSFNLSGRAHALHARLPTPLLVQPGAPVTVVATSDSRAFIDRDNDGRFAGQDPVGPFVLAASVDVGDREGRLMALGSLDLLSNRLATDEATQAWLAALLAEFAPPGHRILLDQSHRPQAGVAAVAAWVVRSTSESPARWAASGAALLAAAALVLFARGPRPWGRHQFQPDRYRSRAKAPDGGPLGMHDPDSTLPAFRSWTPRGAMAVAALALLAIAGAVLRSATALAAALALAAPLMAASLGRRPRLDVERHLSADTAPEGQEVAVRLKVKSRGSGDLEVRDGVPNEAEVLGEGTWRRLLVRRGQRVDLSYDVRPALRGPHRIGLLRARAQDPFGLRIWDVPFGEAAELRVLPRRELLKRIGLRVRRPDILMGAHAVNRAGEGSEFQALREYQPGDAMRTVNWRASARSKSLMVNQRVLESQTIVTLVLDARAVADCGPARSTPLACSARAALTIAAAAARTRDRMRFASFGSHLTELPPAPAARFLHQLSDHLSALPAAGAMGFDEVAARLVRDVRPGTPVALFSGLEGRAGFEEGARRLLGRGASLTVFAFPIATAGPGEAPDPGAEAIHAQRRANLEAMRATGAAVHEVREGIPLDALLTMNGVAR